MPSSTFCDHVWQPRGGPTAQSHGHSIRQQCRDCGQQRVNPAAPDAGGPWPACPGHEWEPLPRAHRDRCRICGLTRHTAS